MIHLCDTERLRVTMQEQQELGADVSRQIRRLAGGYETAIRQVNELAAAVDQAIERLHAGEFDAALAILVDVAIHD